MTKHYLPLMSLLLLAGLSATAGSRGPATFARPDNGILNHRNVKITGVEQNIYSSSLSDGEVMKFKAPSRASETSTLTSIQESFEGWDGVTPGWLPDGWTLQSKNSDNTWHISKPTTKFSPTNGNFHMICNGATSAQEEMLITPEFKVPNNYRLYADLTLSLFDIFDQEFFDETTKTFSQRRPCATVVVKAYVDGFWNEIYNVASVAGRLTDEELYQSHRDNEKFTLRVNLERFAGKDIKLAFIYKGENGQDVALDYVAVQQINNQAVYRRPQGFFFIGVDPYYNQYSPDVPWLMGPAYVDATWYAYATRDVEDINWTFYRGDNSTFSTNEGRPVVNNIYSVTWAPELTAISSGVPSVTYQFDAAYKSQGAVAYGGDTSNPTTGNTYGLGNYNANAGIQNPMYANNTKANVFGPLSNDAFWHTYNRHMLAIGNYYEKPLSPYWFDKLWISFADFDADADAEFTLTIYRIKDGGIDTANPIATTKAYGRDAITSESGLGSLTFDFGKNFVTVDDAIMIRIDGIFDNPKVRSFAPVCQSGLHFDGENTSYAFYYEDYYGKKEEYVALTSYLLNNFNYPFLITFNGCFPFLFAEDGDNTFDAPVAGGSKTFTINSLYQSSEWNVENLPEWVTEFNPSDTFEDVDGVIKCGLNVEVEPLPTDIPGRYAEVRLTAPGIKCPLIITQGDISGPDGVNDIAYGNNEIKISVSDGVVNVTAPNDDVTCATVFSTTGLTIARPSFQNGQAQFTLPSRGVYVIVLSDGKSVKFIY